ncbi:MAG: phosphatase PAP2 family protein [Eubacterium sp.]|nr:phosphatase PAP2 family protein [Eubacterium sp.]
MKKESYIKMVNNVKAHKRLDRALVFANQIMTGLVYICFIVLLFTLGYNKKIDELIRIVLVCGISFILVSVFRFFFNAKRPYTLYEYEPVVAKKKEGQSMPSRHVFSAFVIAMAFAYINWKFSIIFFVVASLIAIHRVIVGVHFIKDVVVGALIGIVAGIIGFFII